MHAVHRSDFPEQLKTRKKFEFEFVDPVFEASIGNPVPRGR